LVKKKRKKGGQKRKVIKKDPWKMCIGVIGKKEGGREKGKKHCPCKKKKEKSPHQRYLIQNRNNFRKGGEKQNPSQREKEV